MVTIKLDRDDATELYWFFEALRNEKVKEVCGSAGLESQLVLTAINEIRHQILRET